LTGVAIIDVGIGNLRSVEKAFAKLGRPVVRTSDAGRLREASHLVLPGVGAFGDFMAALGRAGVDGLVHDRVQAGVPVLGICVGMQALYEESEEFGRHRGLGLLRGRVARFPEQGLVVPHSGWNVARPTREDPLFPGTDPAWFYFVHSYHVADDDPATALATCEYGRTFTCAARRGAVWGVQFHPEKSQAAGLALLDRFAQVGSPVVTA
jgi:glutamine amidotransferase